MAMKSRLVFRMAWILGMVLVANPTRVAGSEVEEALNRWEGLPQDAGSKQVDPCCNAVRAEAASGNEAVVDRLLAIAQSSAQSGLSRSKALWVASELATDAGAHRIVVMIKAQVNKVKQIHADRMFPDRERALTTERNLLLSFVSFCGAHLIDVMENQAPLLDLLRDCYAARYQLLRSDARSHCARLIAQCNVPLSARQAVVLEIIGNEDERLRSAPDVLLDLLDASAFPRLRQMVRAEAAQDRLHDGALHALAYLGDAEIVRDLEALRLPFESRGNTAKASYKRMLWQIQVQNPPSRLLDYIASAGSDPGVYFMRTWAVRRAVGLGLARSEIRSAILQHDKNAKDKYARVELPRMKEQATELGILEPGDLPSVPPPRKRHH